VVAFLAALVIGSVRLAAWLVPLALWLVGFSIGRRRAPDASRRSVGIGWQHCPTVYVSQQRSRHAEAQWSDEQSRGPSTTGKKDDSKDGCEVGELFA